jgi:hypothetical protein
MGIDPRKDTLPDLGIPIIDDKSIQVSQSNAQRNTNNQDEWSTMERDLLEANIEKGYILKSKKALALQQQDDNRVICAVGGKSMHACFENVGPLDTHTHFFPPRTIHRPIRAAQPSPGGGDIVGDHPRMQISGVH